MVIFVTLIYQITNLSNQINLSNPFNPFRNELPIHLTAGEQAHHLPQLRKENIQTIC